MKTEIKAAIGEALGCELETARTVGGGDINDAWRLGAPDGRVFFAKTNDSAPADLFDCESAGLEALRRADALPVPEVLARGRVGVTQFLVLGWIESGPPAARYGERFGARLAELHRHSRDLFGFDGDNYIGSLPQSNRDHTSWLAFFRDERLGRQLDMARESGRLSSATLSRAEALLGRLGDYLPERVITSAGEPASRPSLLHGDLWGGNFMLDEQGEAVLIDPATYYGDREIEIAFTELFGGFPVAFYEAYRSTWPLESGYRERRDLYNLYPLLVHANLFGGHYASRVDSVIRRYL